MLGKCFQLGCWTDPKVVSSIWSEIVQGAFLRRAKHERASSAGTNFRHELLLEAGDRFIL